MTQSNAVDRLKQLLNLLNQHSSTMIGYPVNINHDYSPLLPFLKYSLNNIGDPFQDCLYKINTRKIEREVVHYFGKLYQFPKDNVWGYVTSGGTEGNLFGIYLGRERLKTDILIASRDVHYSLGKIARMLKMKLLLVASAENGEIDYSELEQVLAKLNGEPVVINLNLGTTVKGAVDDLKRVKLMLKKYKIDDYHLHCDAALYGMILPFINSPRHVTFADGFDSIAISGHKFIGSPFPCGIALTKRAYIGTLQNVIEYIDSIDDTILGSRSGHAPLFLWYAIKTIGTSGFKKMARQCMDNAKYLEQKLSGLQYPVLRNRSSNTVIFKRPAFEIVDKWQLASQNGWSHVVVMPSVTKRKLNLFLKDLRRSLDNQ